MLDRRIKTAARDTMRHNSRLDDKSTGCASVPAGRTTCYFCLSMAAVGVAHSFKVMDIEGRRFHDSCDCAFVPGFIGHGVDIPGYNSDELADMLNEVKRDLGLPTNSKLTSAQERLVEEELERRQGAPPDDPPLFGEDKAEWPLERVYREYDAGNGKTGLYPFGVIAPGSEILDREPIAGGEHGRIRDIKRIIEAYQGTPDEWMKWKGHGMVMYDEDGSINQHIVHWYEKAGVKWEIKIKDEN